MFLRRRRILVLLLGDIFLLYVALVAALFVSFPAERVWGAFIEHAVPFSYLFVLWVVVFFIAGLYDKDTLFFRKKLPSILLNALLVNGVLAIAFFYLIPLFHIAPKTNLFIYLVASFLLILGWRLLGGSFLTGGKKQKALIIVSGSAFEELVHELKNNNRYNLDVERDVDINKIEFTLSLKNLAQEIPTKGISVVIIDMNHPKIDSIMPQLYNLLFAGIRFFDLHTVYEDVYERIPLSLIHYQWFLKNVSASTRGVYDFFKRFMDIVLGLILGVIAFVVCPVVGLVVLLFDGRPVLLAQERIGQYMKLVRLYKFRSMEQSEDGVWVGETKNKVTKVGSFLRRTRLDELPQIWNIVRGDLSFIGPRPDIRGLGEKLLREIPYYNIRYMVKPGLSGWAQIKQDIPPQSVEESKVRLSYDLFYIKNRSVMLDLSIALRTLKTLLSRSGR